MDLDTDQGEIELRNSPTESNNDQGEIELRDLPTERNDDRGEIELRNLSPRQPETLRIRTLLYDNELCVDDPENPIVPRARVKLSSDQTLPIPEEPPLPTTLVQELEKYNVM